MRHATLCAPAMCLVAFVSLLLTALADGRALAQAPASFPVTAAAPLGKELLAAINSGDSLRLARWADTSFLPGIHAAMAPQIIAFFRSIQISSGGVDLVRAYGDEWIMMDVRIRRTGRLAHLGLGMEPGTEARPLVSGWHAYPLSAGRAALSWPAHRLGDSAIAVAIAENVERVVDRDEFSGVVRIMRHDSLVFERAYGFADRARGVRNTPATRFHTASVGKMFTAVAIAQLVETGKLRYEDTLATVLPGYPNREGARRITLHHLLTHTSGLGAEPASARRHLAAYAAEEPAFPPGSRYRYSNAGYEILAMVVERVSGMPFATYLAQHVFGPAGMSRTDSSGVSGAHQYAIGYGWGNDDPIGVFPRQLNGLRGGSAGTGAGGHYLTAEDLTRFALAFRAARLVSPAAIRTMTTPKPPAADYGYGIDLVSVRTPTGVRAAPGHGGGGFNQGVDANIRWFSDGEWTVAVVGNYSAPAAYELTTQILTFLARQ